MKRDGAVGTDGVEIDVVAARTAASSCQAPVPWRSRCQIATSFLPFLAICAVMYAGLLCPGLALPYGAILALGVLAAGFLVRIFIIQHDCGHGAFFQSRWANDAVGVVCSLFTMTPYANWRRQHAGHHGVWNNLDCRLTGADMYSTCLTVDEYRALSPAHRLFYRVSRHPLVALVILPPLIFLLLYRVPFDTPKSWRKERRVVHGTNLALGAIVLALGFAFGFRAVLLVQLPIAMIAAVFGVWLFSLQHRFERTLWLRQDRWDYAAASLHGSSYLKLPKVLQWFTGNIGFHHIHHLNPRVPNYRLEECYDANPVLQAAPVLTLWGALKSWRYALWDEATRRMVPFAAA